MEYIYMSGVELSGVELSGVEMSGVEMSNPLSQKLELEPQHLWKLRSPKASLRNACFLRGIQSLHYISHLISSKYQIIDDSLS